MVRRRNARRIDVCCLACRSQPTIFIRASFVPSLFGLDTAKSTRAVQGSTSLCHQLSRPYRISSESFPHGAYGHYHTGETTMSTAGVVVTDEESRRARSDDTLERLRDLVKDVATETDPDKIQTLFEQIRRLLRVQLAETKQRIMDSSGAKTPRQTCI